METDLDPISLQAAAGFEIIAPFTPIVAYPDLLFRTLDGPYKIVHVSRNLLARFHI